ncbi:MAG: hypothetical protein ACOC5R_00770 [Elusimicrobiota bacterium]
MEKEEKKNFLKQVEKIAKDFGTKASELTKSIEKDATYGTKAGMVKIEQLTLESEKNKLINQLGKKTYSLLRKKEISHKSLKELFEKIKDLDNKIRGKKVSLTKMKKSRKKKKNK